MNSVYNIAPWEMNEIQTPYTLHDDDGISRHWWGLSIIQYSKTSKSFKKGPKICPLTKKSAWNGGSTRKESQMTVGSSCSCHKNKGIFCLRI